MNENDYCCDHTTCLASLKGFPTMPDRDRIASLAPREDFPIFSRMVHEKPLVYLDSAATSQKPLAVLDAMDEYYRRMNANVHRGVYTISEEASAAYEAARKAVATFIHARSVREIIFTRNTTEGLNLLAHSWGMTNLHAGDVVLLTEMEHHSNLVPWQMVASQTGARLEFVPVLDDGTLDLAAYAKLLERFTPKVVSFSLMSNVLGTIPPAKEMITQAHAAGAIVFCDGAQAVAHLPVDVRDLGCDALAFSSHKMLGPTGIGVLYGTRALLENMEPFMGGGDMIREVHLRDYMPNDLPWKFEAGTPAIAEAIGLHAAIRYLTDLTMTRVAAQEDDLAAYMISALQEIPGARVVGPLAGARGATVSFTMEGIHPHDLATLLDADGIAIRAGHHCAQPLHERFGLPATARASASVYTSSEDIDALAASLRHAVTIFA
jgi:cysteine desulfurase / selenocysteine lyase